MEKELMAKAFVFHASRKFHKSRLSTSSQTTVKFVKDKLEEKENIPENENTASTPSSSFTSSSIPSCDRSCDRRRNPLDVRCHFQQLLPKLLPKYK